MKSKSGSKAVRKSRVRIFQKIQKKMKKKMKKKTKTKTKPMSFLRKPPIFQKNHKSKNPQAARNKNPLQKTTSLAEAPSAQVIGTSTADFRGKTVFQLSSQTSSKTTSVISSSISMVAASWQCPQPTTKPI